MEPVVGVILGSKSDLPLMESCVKVLEDLGLTHEMKVCSAHRNPRGVMEWATSARSRGLKVVIAAAGGAAHLPGVVAAWTDLPVIGVPVPTQHLGGVDSLYSIVQMPAGVPVATVAKRLDVSTRTARRIIESGELKAYRIRRQWRVFESDLQGYLERQPNRSSGHHDEAADES